MTTTTGKLTFAETDFFTAAFALEIVDFFDAGWTVE